MFGRFAREVKVGAGKRCELQHVKVNVPPGVHKPGEVCSYSTERLSVSELMERGREGGLKGTSSPPPTSREFSELGGRDEELLSPS